MTTYYYGNIEFGTFRVQLDGADSALAIIHDLKDVKQFDTPENAWQYYVDNAVEFESYISENAKDEFDTPYEIVYKQRK